MTMKKYLVLAVMTLAVIAAVIAAGAFSAEPQTAVVCRTLRRQEARQTVVCSGYIEAADTVNVTLPQTCLAKTVYVSVGQAVSAGDVLFSVDTEGTAAALTDKSLSPEAATVSDEIVSPVSGIVSVLNVSSGKVADTARPCAVIAGSDILQVHIYVPEKSIGALEIGQSVTVSGAGFRESGYPGKLTAISSSATQRMSGTVSQTVVEAVVLLDERYADDSLRLGLTASAEIVTQIAPDVLTVPYDCVVEGSDGTRYVYVAENGKAEKRVLTVGGEWADGYEVLNGVRAGERLITAPESVTRDGMPVTDIAG